MSKLIRKAKGRNGAIAFAIAIAIAAKFIPALLAVHDTGAFELDGNATSSVSDDWDKVCHKVMGTDCSTSFDPSSNATATSFTAEPSPNATIFTSGGSKDPQNIDQWAWKNDTGGLPDKDNLLHSFAARYQLPPTDPATYTGPNPCPNGTSGASFDPNKKCDVLFFGSDRLDNSGDAQQGFWFFQKTIGLGTNPVGGGSGFTGVHTTGDLLVISDFSNGGGTSTITIYAWDPTCTATNKPDGGCGDANLRRLASSTGANCATAAPSDGFCGIVNPGPGLTPAPWPFLDKSGNSSFLNGEFYEGGINLSLIGLAGECFATVASETRSSTSTTATLKDFILGGFAKCESGLTTAPRDGAGGIIPPGGLSIGTGSVSVRDSATLTIVGAQSWTGTLTFFLCGPNVSPCTSGGTQIGSSITVTNTTSQPILSAVATLTSVGNYCWRGTFISGTSGVPDAADATAGECFTVNPVTPTIPTVASGAIQLGGQISDVVNLRGTASEPGTPVVNGPLGSPAGGTLTFRLYGPADTTCTATPVFTSAAVTVTGDGLYSSGNFTPTQVGTYHWIVSYTGDSPNTNGNTGFCGASNESVVVTARPAISTAQTFTVKDSATITVAAGAGNLTGSVQFQLYDNNACSGGLLFDSGSLAVSGPSPQTVSTVTTTITTSQPTLSWLVVYTSTNPDQPGTVTSTCNTEGANLTIHNQ